VTARSGAEALELLEVDAVDCVLLDRLMPGLSGLDVCRRVKEHPVLREVPVLMLTMMDEPEAVLEGLNAGAEDYVAKASGLDIIRGRLRAQLRRKHFEVENRRMRLRLADAEMQAVEARAQRELADARARHVEELSRKNAELEAANRELESFAHTVSHDLRGPLRAIQGLSRVVIEDHGDALPDDARRLLDRVVAGAGHAMEVVEDLLRLSTASLHALRPTRFDLADTARQVLRRLQLQDPSRSVEIDVAPSLPVWGDRGLLSQALENLLGNAWKYTRKKDRARIAFRAEDRDGERVYLVEDDGAGFDMRYVHKVFEPFQRLHSTEEFEGTGIGLSTVRRIVERHDGRIWAASEVGRGATFSFTLGLREPT
jgi:signal transduction histidine kinase